MHSLHMCLQALRPPCHILPQLSGRLRLMHTPKGVNVSVLTPPTLTELLLLVQQLEGTEVSAAEF